MSTTEKNLRTWTVRPLGGVAWESGIDSLAAARASAREAEHLGLRDVVIIDDSTGETVEAEIGS